MHRIRYVAVSALLVAGVGLPPIQAVADETCQSPYMAKIVGQEDFVYVWTPGLVAFLESLTGSNVATLVADAKAAPIGDPGQVGR